MHTTMLDKHARAGEGAASAVQKPLGDRLIRVLGRLSCTISDRPTWLLRFATSLVSAVPRCCVACSLLRASASSCCAFLRDSCAAVSGLSHSEGYCGRDH